MKIVRIFAEKLFSFHFDGETENELERVLNLWNDTNYLFKFAKKNIPNIDLSKYIQDRIDDVEQINNIIDEISNNDQTNLSTFFEPLKTTDFGLKLLTLQKGKTRQQKRSNHLRIYAIKIDENCYVITGGAIKLSQKMHDHPTTLIEYEKLVKCREFLRENGVIDDESFFELIIELNEQ
ncbi:MAG TPA: hypothetical protein DDX39_05315 [Bacteroidales bacterium]|nr:MAG: hypothetical protein A2W98_10865 [Bacteroidetes bacterium GWF2_33_38]OFY73917.1 MAG: hypothetical protein A2265_08470 [Bacteroidetes bacterium RIFOXYA12_FULL_33_9]HBF88043.1 hypothetical protein [Bacteroidales bacterium]